MDTGNGLHYPKRVVTLDHILVITMHQPGKWLFVAPTDEPISITCDGNPASYETLRHVGVLTLVGVCTVTAQSFSLRTIRRITQVANEDYLPPFNLTLSEMDEVSPPRVTSDIGTVKLVKVLRNPEELARLGTRVSSIKACLDQDDQHLEQYYHNLGCYSLGTIAPIALVCFAVYKCYKRKHNSTSTTLTLTPNSVTPAVNIQLEPLVSRPDNLRAALNRSRERRFRWADQIPQDRTNATGRHAS
ncbi:uncharacterized protein LOC107273492 [Cephus cinctus]|uniref:Uncharacterized protein LOC107273492 n=1 Tax=Cephus cinctus TaxID=211228 RepID=A0AAJ7CDD8_CEPCN|nr:uncharacterized protein LOC107273492 [Cephus cinctus]